MSLQIWLPLNGNLDNQGLQNVTVSGGTVYANGKIGKCIGVTSSAKVSIVHNTPTTSEFSFAFWMKIPENMASGTTWENMLYFTAITSAGGSVSSCSMNWANYDAVKIWDDSNHQWCWAFAGTRFQYNTWHHWCITHTASGDGVQGKVYIDGTLIGTYTNATQPLKIAPSRIELGRGVVSDILYYNDFRLYDHALSAKEVRELAKGLVLHYKLDENLTQLNNCYATPKFQTSASGGGWSHWARSGANGSYGQNTDKQYIYDKSLTYSHWVSNSSTATAGYLLYQSPAFEGGHRSLQCICKEENGARIDENVIFPAWNARSGGAPSYEWTSISSLGSGFYLCKCEDIQQDGSNDLVGFFVCPGHKVYFSEAYLENDRAICSDIFNQGFLNIVHDSSGFGYNGTITGGSLTTASDSARYSASTAFPGTVYIDSASPTAEVKTIAFWAKWNAISSSNSIIYVDYKSKTGFGLASNELICSSANLSTKTFNKSSLVANTWYHFVIVCPNGASDVARKLYINGVEQTATSNSNVWASPGDKLNVGKRSTTSNDGFNGKLSDFRMYSTALSADDILELYHTSASIDKNGNYYARELIE